MEGISGSHVIVCRGLSETILQNLWPKPIQKIGMKKYVIEFKKNSTAKS